MAIHIATILISILNHKNVIACLLVSARKVFDQVVVSAWNSTRVTVSWIFLPEFTGYEYNVTLTNQLLGNGNCDSEGGPPQVVMLIVFF